MMPDPATEVARPEFKLKRVLASAFLAGEGLDSQKVLRQVLEDWGGIYDGEVISLPVPPAASSDIPSIVLSSRNGVLRVELFRLRVNLSWFARDEFEANLAELLRTFADRIAAIAEKNAAPVNRLGIVVERVAGLKDPGYVLASYFCRTELLKGPLNNLKGFELHVHTVSAILPDVQINNWTRIKASKEAGTEYEYVLAIQDINTLAEERETRRFSRDQVVSFFAAATKEFDGFLELYFPHKTQVRLNL